MGYADYGVLIGYFVVLIGIGIWASRHIKKQEDFLMGGRSFGKLLQTFAAFGAGTGSSDPVNTGRTTYTSGMSGMWSVMYWLFVTPFYWITGVWYRRMRHLTLGDWFVERYESKSLGFGYCIFGLLFFMVYGSMLFSAIGKVAAPLVGFDAVVLFGTTVKIEYILVPVIGVVVLIYGIMGGLEAAYFTDLIQGICIILLSVILIPIGLNALVDKFGSPGEGMLAGFRILHEQLPPEQFSVVGVTSTSEFPWYRILAVVLINLVGIVVQPHFIATGGGSAKTETSARVGLVTGNFLKRFCTIGWVLTGLIAVALFANNPTLVLDPDKTWGLASRELLAPIGFGLTGLMLACLLAALMSSVDAYMVVGAGLVTRNIYAAYVNPIASEKQYLLVGRLTGAVVILGAVLISLLIMNVFEQLQLTWVFGVLFAAPFWIGMYWRRATRTAAWITVAYCAFMFFLIPYFAPQIDPSLRTNERFLATNQIVLTTSERNPAPADVYKRHSWQEAYRQALEHETSTVAVETLRKLGPPRVYLAKEESAVGEWSGRFWSAFKDPDSQKRLADLKELSLPPNTDLWQRAYDALQNRKEDGARQALDELGKIREKEAVGGQSIYWGSGIKIIDRNTGMERIDIKPRPVEGTEKQIDSNTTEVTLQYELPPDVERRGMGNFRLDFLLYPQIGIDLTTKSNAMLETLELPPKIITPFLVMILISFITPRNSQQALDRYYAKMATPVDPDREIDRRNLEEAYANPVRMEQQKLFPGTSLEFKKPTMTDIVGVVISFLVCFGIIGLAVWIAGIGS